MLGIETRWKVKHIIRHWHNDDYMMDYIFFTNIYKVFWFLLPDAGAPCSPFKSKLNVCSDLEEVFIF